MFNVRFYSDGRFVHLSSYSKPEIIAKKLNRFEDIPHEAVWGTYEYCNYQIRLLFSVKPKWVENNLYDTALNRIHRMVSYL